LANSRYKLLSIFDFQYHVGVNINMGFFHQLLWAVIHLLVSPILFLFPAKLQVEHISLDVEDLPKKLNGTKIIHLTDFHWDFKHHPERISELLLRNIVQICEDEKADLILLTGDYIQLDPEPIDEFSKNWLSKLVPLAKNGVFAVLGNHDQKLPGAGDLISKSLESIGIRVLKNESVQPLGSGLEIVGVGDLWGEDCKPQKVFPSLDRKISTIVLAHNPDTAEILRNWRVDLQLSGHTHGGQICFPSGEPIIPKIASILRYLPQWIIKYIPAKGIIFGVVKNWTWAKGLHKVERKDKTGFNFVYTNRGLATHPPIRLWCDPELAIIQLFSK